MTPKEKAKELVDGFVYELDSIDDNWIKKIEAKACALIAADEVLNSYCSSFDNELIFTKNPDDDSITLFWMRVKEEITNL